MFIQTEDTPNPATMKFLPSRTVVATPLDIPDRAQAAVSPLAQALFNIEGVAGVFFGTDFISVTRAADVPWPVLRPAILATIMDHFVAGKPVLADGGDAGQGACACGSACNCASEKSDCSCGDDCGCGCVSSSDADSDVVKQIKELLDLRIRPAVAQDGGDVAFERFEDGVVYLRLKGACAGCPSATMTLKVGIEQMLRHFIPEVTEVRRVL